MRYGQLIEYIMRIIFFEKSCTKCEEETIIQFVFSFFLYCKVAIKICSNYAAAHLLLP